MTRKPLPEPLVGPGTAAVLAGVSVKTWSRMAWRDRGLLEALHWTAGGHRRWPVSAVEACKRRLQGGVR